MADDTLMTGQAAGADDAAAAGADDAAKAGAAQAGDQKAAAAAADDKGAAADAAAKGGEEAGKDGKPDDKPAGAPDNYEFKAPDGVTLDDAVVGAFAEVAKDLNLPQEQAQKVIDKIAPVLATQATERLKAARTEWVETAKADKEFGGDKLEENLGVAKKALEAFATPELRTLLEDSGLGDHPDVIRLFFRVGKAISEDGVVSGKPGTSAPLSIAQRMYPNMNP